MAQCYRNGGCGPYEGRSCSECPASDPEYLKPRKESTPTSTTKTHTPKPWPPCDFCRGVKAMSVDARRKYQTTEDNEGFCTLATDVVAEFCPKCGRPLTSNALEIVKEIRN